MTRIGRIYAV